ncbi:MAG: PD40 domain-containing protein, partial [Candidatus Omnitrophica bacterium]|nr:PD40 domain-containing protein [Candidatus Omnitrophota bacterium]
MAFCARATAERSLRDLIEADWVDRDQEYRAANGAESFSLAHTRSILERAERVTARLAPSAAAARLEALRVELEALKKDLARVESMPEASEETRGRLYLSAREVARRIAFTNPLLDMDKILFIKRHHPKGVFHMCDQFYGFNAVSGGGLYVLADPFGEAPKVIDLLKDSVVESGRLKGRKLEGGAFLSPELSFDGKTILFAYSEAKGKDLEWTPESCFHLFRVNIDGTGLVQLTDGPWDDFDPCFLPDGRVAFISERRGGYLRCGRHCPTYTLYGMDSDGTNITCLSFHETHEWQPSVANDGMLVYTRWDYVDRDTNIAHHIWICFPDGRDPRSFHGNYPNRREDRPWMEMDIRAIPGSRKFVATAAAHHGHALGSLVLINPEVEDDGSMSQLARLTPEVP